MLSNLEIMHKARNNSNKSVGNQKTYFEQIFDNRSENVFLTMNNILNQKGGGE